MISLKFRNYCTYALFFSIAHGACGAVSSASADRRVCGGGFGWMGFQGRHGTLVGEQLRGRRHGLGDSCRAQDAPAEDRQKWRVSGRGVGR